ncbi:MAG: heavy metal-binding domain-containing protein [Solirubrobacteraceae bacterium]
MTAATLREGATVEEEEQEADAFEDAASLERVEGGHIPDVAERRLAELKQGAGTFTSDLSVADFALCRQLGLTPLSQVMGTSVYQVGYQPTAGYGMAGEFGVGGGFGNRSGFAREIGELPVLSQAWNEARERAFARLAEEAASVRADAVVGVKVRSGVAGWTQVAGAIEYFVTGTAVRRDGAHSGGAGGTVVTELSVADYAKLLIAGVEPIGIVAWTSVFFISSIYFQAEREELGFGGALGSGAFGGGSFRNFEYKGATQGFYGAREQVMDRLGEQARQLRASGIVGVRIGHTVRGTEGSGGPQAAGLIASFSALGTAVQDVDASPTAPMTTIDLTT